MMAGWNQITIVANLKGHCQKTCISVYNVHDRIVFFQYIVYYYDLHILLGRIYIYFWDVFTVSYFTII